MVTILVETFGGVHWHRKGAFVSSEMVKVCTSYF